MEKWIGLWHLIRIAVWGGISELVAEELDGLGAASVLIRRSD